MSRRWPTSAGVIFVALFVPGLVSADPSASPAAGGPFERTIGVHAVVGTDVTLGLGVGAGVNVVRRFGANTVEIGADFIYHHSSYTDEEALHEYTETTDLSILAVRVNSLFHYDQSIGGNYLIAGSGVAGVSMEWEESSPTDTSLGTPLTNGGSKQDESGTVGALIVNLGIGHVFASGADVRVELPIFVFLNAVGEAASFAPTLAVTGGYRF